MAWLVTRPISAIGGAHLPLAPKIPFEPGVLIVMNHQSMFDIPMVVESVRPGHPRIVTRERYARWIPIISHLLRLYQYPVVDPKGTPSELRRALEEIGEAARTSEVPLALFPEGTRTKDGEIGRFRTAGTKVILRTRPWKVYVLVVDGFWRVARFKDFIRGVANLRGRIELAGVLNWEDPKADPGPFIDEMREVMIRRLADMRAEVPVT
jgi:1-acyl-sn-glycerol-3-phosphate acyltransferase